MSGSTGRSRSNGSRAAAVRRLQAAVAERKEARERSEAAKQVSVERAPRAAAEAEITVHKEDVA